MKKNILLLLIGTVVLFSACSEDRLDITQKGVIPMDSFYKTDADAEKAMTDVYKDVACNVVGCDGISLPYAEIFNLMGDDVLPAGEYYGDNDQFGQIGEFRLTASNSVVEAMYKRIYWSNYHANLVINMFNMGESDVKNRCISEARVIRAWLHMMACIAWGNPPLITEVLEGDAQPANYAGTREEFFEWCAKEAGEAAEYLDERASQTDKEGAVKVTKGFAWAIQGKALIFAGKFAEAKIALKKVIDSEKYALVSGSEFANLFHVSGDGCKEKVFELNIVSNSNASWDNNNIPNRTPWMHNNVWNWRSDYFTSKPLCEGLDGWGGCSVPEDFAAEFVANDGNSPRRKASIISYDEFIHDLAYASDKRLGMHDTTYVYKDKEGKESEKVNYPYSEKDLKEKGLTFVKIKEISADVRTKDNDYERGIAGTGKAANGLYGNGEYLMKKLIVSPEDLGASNLSYVNFNVMRYAEVLLLYAEACVQTGDGDQADWAIKQIRDRAELPEIHGVDMNTVKKEKKFELWLEQCRWADIMRWKDADAIERLKNKGAVVPSLHDEYFIEGKAGYKKNHKAFVTYSTPSKDKGVLYGFVEGRNEFYPYPEKVLISNPGLKQNPGW